MLDDYFASKWVVELPLLDCCPVTDGGGAVIITSLERARDLARKPAVILGVGQSHSSKVIRSEGDLPRSFGGARAGEMAYRMAGVSPGDVDVVQIYDAFTPRVLHDLVAYGFAKPEEIDGFVAGGTLAPGGRLPANTAGGLLSEGPLSGFGHLREAVKQIRSECGGHQVKNVEISMATGYGGAPHEAPPTVSYSCLLLGK
jgi:acetyl-CoA acetyltransferase